MTTAKSAEEPQSNSTVSQKGGPTDTTGGKVIANYDPDIDYKLEGSDLEIKAFDKEEENSDAEYAKMEQS